MERRLSIEAAKRVLRIEAEAVQGLVDRLDANFDRAVDIVLGCKGRVVVTGLGKSGLIGRKVAATFASTGTPALFLHPTEALHGDLGMMVRNDVLLALSYGGEGAELLQLLATVKRLGIPVIAVTGNKRSTLAGAADAVLDIAVKEEACSLNLAPTASTTAALAMGDALAIALLERRGFGPEDFAALHPGGRLGSKLQRVENVMHGGDDRPLVRPETRMPDVIYEIGRKGLGLAAVVEDGDRLVGIITDGDLRRLMQRRPKDILELTAGECMTKTPVTIRGTEFAAAALRMMEERKITSILVVGDGKRLEGVVHIHDLWTLQLF